MDNRTPDQRRRIMQAVRQKNTGPELAVRQLLHGMGYRYRLHAKGLPGTPDIIFRGRKKVIFVHGCFWHAHGCKKGKAPKSRLDYWAHKLEQNEVRDRRNCELIESMGWKALTVWACEVDDPSLPEQLDNFLGSRKFRSTNEPQAISLLCG